MSYSYFITNAAWPHFTVKTKMSHYSRVWKIKQMSSLQHNGGGFFCFLHSSTADIIVRMNYLSTLIYLNYGSHMEIFKKKRWILVFYRLQDGCYFFVISKDLGKPKAIRWTLRVWSCGAFLVVARLQLFPWSTSFALSLRHKCACIH